MALAVQMPAEHHRHRDNGDIEELLPDIRGLHARTPIRIEELLPDIRGLHARTPIRSSVRAR